MAVTLEHVRKSFGDRVVLRDVTLTLPDHGRVCFFGPSGCGKTTLLRLICGLDKPDGGRILVPEGTRFACHFQEDRLLPWYTALENLTLTAESREEALRFLTLAGLADASGLYPDELSGGMRRRASLARALGHPSDALVLDEPVREMDSELCARMLDLIDQSAGSRLMILVTHDRAQAERLGCDLIPLPM